MKIRQSNDSVSVVHCMYNGDFTFRVCFCKSTEHWPEIAVARDRPSEEVQSRLRNVAASRSYESRRLTRPLLCERHESPIDIGIDRTFAMSLRLAFVDESESKRRIALIRSAEQLSSHSAQLFRAPQTNATEKDRWIVCRAFGPRFERGETMDSWARGDVD